MFYQKSQRDNGSSRMQSCISLSRYVDLMSGLAPGTDVEWMAMTQNDAEGEDFTPKCNCSSGSNSAVCKCFAPH